MGTLMSEYHIEVVAEVLLRHNDIAHPREGSVCLVVSDEDGAIGHHAAFAAAYEQGDGEERTYEMGQTREETGTVDATQYHSPRYLLPRYTLP